MKYMKIISFMVFVAVIGTAESGLAYPSDWEGSMITKNYSQSEQNWWMKGYLLQGGYKHQLMDFESFQVIYNSNGKRYFGTVDDSLNSVVDSIPTGKEVRLGRVINEPFVTPVPNTNLAVGNSSSWVPSQGESCWSSGSNLGICAGRAANGFGSVVGQFARGFFGGLFNPSS